MFLIFRKICNISFIHWISFQPIIFLIFEWENINLSASTDFAKMLTNTKHVHTSEISDKSNQSETCWISGSPSRPPGGALRGTDLRGQEKWSTRRTWTRKSFQSSAGTDPVSLRAVPLRAPPRGLEEVHCSSTFLLDVLAEVVALFPPAPPVPPGGWLQHRSMLADGTQMNLKTPSKCSLNFLKFAQVFIFLVTSGSISTLKLQTGGEMTSPHSYMCSGQPWFMPASAD